MTIVPITFIFETNNSIITIHNSNLDFCRSLYKKVSFISKSVLENTVNEY